LNNTTKKKTNKTIYIAPIQKEKQLQFLYSIIVWNGITFNEKEKTKKSYNEK